jgi:hypothetical protein
VPAAVETVNTNVCDRPGSAAAKWLSYVDNPFYHLLRLLTQLIGLPTGSVLTAPEKVSIGSLVDRKWDEAVHTSIRVDKSTALGSCDADLLGRFGPVCDHYAAKAEAPFCWVPGSRIPSNFLKHFTPLLFTVMLILTCLRKNKTWWVQMKKTANPPSSDLPCYLLISETTKLLMRFLSDVKKVSMRLVPERFMAGDQEVSEKRLRKALEWNRDADEEHQAVAEEGALHELLEQMSIDLSKLPSSYKNHLVSDLTEYFFLQSDVEQKCINRAVATQRYHRACTQALIGVRVAALLEQVHLVIGGPRWAA